MNECFAPFCRVKVRNGLLMCPPHWRKVSRFTRALVYRTYRDMVAGRQSSADYRMARNRAAFEAVQGEPDPPMPESGATKLSPPKAESPERHRC
jgi:hypothetical protein